ncbi:unnamed protein product, partial [Prorocentrum cordatum]
ASFPTIAGKTVQKEEVVITYETMYSMAGLPILDEDGDGLMGGHSARLGGAGMLASVGLHVYQIELIARWHSPMLLYYAKEAPLNKITQDFVEKKSLLHVNEAIHQLESKINDVDSRAAAALEREIRNLRNGICAPDKGATIKNNATGSWRKAAVEGLHISPDLWRTKCGWKFGRGTYSRIDGGIPAGVDTKRVCE